MMILLCDELMCCTLHYVHVGKKPSRLYADAFYLDYFTTLLLPEAMQAKPANIHE